MEYLDSSNAAVVANFGDTTNGGQIEAKFIVNQVSCTFVWIIANGAVSVSVANAASITLYYTAVATNAANNAHVCGILVGAIDVGCNSNPLTFTVDTDHAFAGFFGFHDADNNNVDFLLQPVQYRKLVSP